MAGTGNIWKMRGGGVMGWMGISLGAVGKNSTNETVTRTYPKQSYIKVRIIEVIESLNLFEPLGSPLTVLYGK